MGWSGRLPRYRSAIVVEVLLKETSKYDSDHRHRFRKDFGASDCNGFGGYDRTPKTAFADSTSQYNGEYTSVFDCDGSKLRCSPPGSTSSAQGHDVRLIPAQFVRPFVKSNKNDYIDAEAIAEAAQRPTMRFVSIKTDDQLDMQALHRTRDRLVARRTGVINQLRAFLLERGIVFRQSRIALQTYMPTLLQTADQVSLPAWIA